MCRSEVMFVGKIDESINYNRHKVIYGSNEDRLTMNCAMNIVNNRIEQLKNSYKRSSSDSNLNELNNLKKINSSDTLNNYIKNSD
jgi:hypothetical protein